jgi:hypothetical protein
MQNAFITPLSRKAKNRFANLMNSDAHAIIEQQNGNRVFVASMNRKYFFWATLDKDPDWMIQL